MTTLSSLHEEKLARGTATAYSSRIEDLLARGFKVRRSGLGTMIGEVSHVLPADVISELTWLNSQFRNPSAHFTKMDWIKLVDEYERRAKNVIEILEAHSGVRAVPTGDVVWFKKPLNYVGGVLALAVIPIHNEAPLAFAMVFGLGMWITHEGIKYFRSR